LAGGRNPTRRENVLDNIETDSDSAVDQDERGQILVISVIGQHTLKDVEERFVTETLKVCKGNKASAARLLGVSLKTVYNMVNRRDEKTKSG
jgi:DNA-binding NtrC family response regulator